MKLPFRRNQQATNEEVPTEIKQYYTEEARDRTDATWLTAVLVFFVTVAVVLGLFYGGRALYRTLFADETPAPETTQQEGDRPQGDIEITAPKPEDNTADEPAQNNDREQDNTADETAEPEVTSPSTPDTGAGDAEEIPATGPDVFF